MAGEENDAFDPTEEEDALVIDEGPSEAEEEEAARQLNEAAASIEYVVLPLSCTNEGKGAPLAMGLQRWWAQQLSGAEVKAAAPVFTALAEQNGRKVPALMVYRDGWTDERALEGTGKFPNAKRALLADMNVDDKNVTITGRIVDVGGEKLETVHELSISCTSEELPAKIHEITGELLAREGKELEDESWSDAFESDNVQAVLSFLVGLGNLSALQGRVVPATSDQLLNPLMDAISRDPNIEIAVQALHNMVDILVPNQPDRAALPLSLQALQIAAQKRPKDKSLFHHLALLLRRLGDLPNAVQAFNQAFNLDPADGNIAASFIDTLRRAGDLDNALKVGQFAIERGNEHAVVLGLYGGLLIEKDQFDDAEPFLRRAVDEGQVASAYGDLANVLWDRAEDGDPQREEDQKEALELLSAALELPRVAKTTLDMLLDLHLEEANEKATTLLLEAAEKHADEALVLKTVASMYLQGDDQEKARPYLEKILALPRRGLDDDAFARRARLGLDLEDFEDRYASAVDKINSGDARAQTDAAKFMREVIAQDQLYWQPHLMLALAVRASEGETSALAHLTNAVQLRPNDPEIRDLLAAILRKQGRAREAVEHLRALVSLKPRDVEPVVSLASAMRDANMYEEARQVCQTALQMVPNNADFKRILASLPDPKK